MPIRVPTYTSRSAPAVVDRGGTSPASTGLPVAQGFQSVSRVLADIHLDAEKQVAGVARMAEFVDRKGQFSDRVGRLSEELAQDTDHRTYFDRARKGIEEAATDALAGINDPVLKNQMTLFISGEKDEKLLSARHQALKLTVDYSRGVAENDIERQIDVAVSGTDARELMAAEGQIGAVIAGAVKGGVWTAQHGEALRRGAKEKIYTTLALRMAEEDPARFLSNHAEGLYGDVDPVRLEEIRRYAKNRNEGVEAHAAATEVWDTYGPGAFGRVQTDVTPLEAGNIDLGNRPRVKNKDGSVSTVRSMSVNIDGREVLIPTVSDDGKILSEKQAVELYRKTGKHLGVFGSAAEATSYAQALHEQQERLYTRNPDEAPVNLDLMVTAIEARFKGDADKTRLAIASVKEKALAHAKGSAERRDANLSTVWKAALAGKSITQIVASREFSSLDGGTQMQVKEHLEDRLAGKPETPQQQIAWAKLARDPERLRKVPLDSLFANGVIHKSRYDDLVKDQAELNGPKGKEKEFKIQSDSEVVKGILEEAGITKKNDLAAQNRFYERFVKNVNAKYPPGKPPTQEQQKTEARLLVGEVAKEGGFWFWGNTQRGLDVTYESIPKGKRDRIEGILKKAGRAYTKDDVVSIYVADEQQGAVE